jgi:hypothetical protein
MNIVDAVHTTYLQYLHRLVRYKYPLQSAQIWFPTEEHDLQNQTFPGEARALKQSVHGEIILSRLSPFYKFQMQLASHLVLRARRMFADHRVHTYPARI